MTVAGRSLWGGTEAEVRAGFAALYASHNFAIDAQDPAATVIFPAVAIMGLKFIAVLRNTRLPMVSAFHALTSEKSAVRDFSIT